MEDLEYFNVSRVGSRAMAWQRLGLCYLIPYFIYLFLLLLLLYIIILYLCSVTFCV